MVNNKAFGVVFGFFLIGVIFLIGAVFKEERAASSTSKPDAAQVSK